MPHSNTVLSQLLKLIPRHEFESLALQVDGNRRSTALNRWSQFVALSIGQLNGRQSLRDIESCLDAQSHLHYHLGIQRVTKSSLSRANEHYDYQFYARLFERLYGLCAGKGQSHSLRFKQKLFSLDGSLLDVSMKLFPWADYNLKKSAFKLHIGLDHAGLLPCFVRVTHGRTSENEIAWQFTPPTGSVVVFDKGYNNFLWHKSLTDQGIFWVTRIRGNALYRVIKSHKTPANKAIIRDELIEYSSKVSQQKNLYPIRMITYQDPETKQRYQFITNHRQWSAQTVADIYKQRWQIELFFKWIKQNLKIKSFLGNSKNAVLTQVLAALCIYLLIAYLKLITKTRQSMQFISRLLHTNLFAKRQIKTVFEKYKPDKKYSPQLNLALRRP